MRSRTLILAAFAIVTFEPAAAQSRILAVCSASTGRTVTAGQDGRSAWTDASVQGVTILRIGATEYDILTRDAGVASWARKNDAAITAAPKSTDNTITLTAVYPTGTIEIFQLTMNAKGGGSLAWSSMKARVAGVTRASLFSATCQRPQ